MRHKMHNKNQRGMTFLGVTLLLVIAIMLINFGVKLIPPYINNYTVKGIIKSIVDKTQKYDNSTPVEEYQQTLRSEFDKALVINNIDSIKAQNITVNSNGNGYQIQVDYDVQTHLLGNIDALIHFKNTIEVVNDKT